MNGPHFRSSVLVGVVAVLAVVTPARAQFEHFMGSSILGSLGKNQSSAFVHTFMAALADTPDAGSVAFKLPAEGKSGEVDGTLTLLRTKMVGSEPCRQIKSELSQKDKKEQWAGWYCKQSNGKWKGRPVAD